MEHGLCRIVPGSLGRRPHYRAALAEVDLRALPTGRRGVISYAIGWSGQILSFSATALARFERHPQARWSHCEAGGQLFARVSSGHIAVEVVTGPQWLDRRTRHTYQPHRPSEQREIEHHHRLGLHFVGDWHTHAEQELLARTWGEVSAAFFSRANTSPSCTPNDPAPVTTIATVSSECIATC